MLSMLISYPVALLLSVHVTTPAVDISTLVGLLTFCFSIIIVYLTSFVSAELLSVTATTSGYVPAALLAAIVITPALDTVIPESPNFLAYVYIPFPTPVTLNVCGFVLYINFFVLFLGLQ